MPRGPLRQAALFAVAGALGAPSATAQVSATLDAGFARVEYDGFLPSSAMSVTPALRFDHRDWTLAARGTFLQFESGSQSLQGILAGTLFTPPAGIFRGEISVSGGASTYRQFPGFSHVLGRARLHALGVGRGGWISASAGQTSLGAAPRLVSNVAVGGWTHRFGMTMDVSAAHTSVGDTAFTDFETSGRMTRGVVQVEGLIGARVWSRGGGHGVYGEASASVPLANRLALVAGAGRYPTDPTRGSIAGRYFSLGLRMTGLLEGAGRQPHPGAQMFRRADDPAETAVTGTNGRFAAATLDLRPRGGAFIVAVQASWAQHVEVMGDFTDWQPTPLTRTARGTWEATFVIAPGLHRLNVRLDGGEWSVPHGTTLAEDEFGGRVGTIVVP